MQSIERYGVIALLFLVVTVVAVLMWDTEDPAQGASAARADLAAARPPAVPAGASQPRPITQESRLEARTEEGPTRSARAPLVSQERPSWADEPASDELEPAGELASEAEPRDTESLEGARTIAAERPSPEQADEPKAKPPASAGARPKSERLHLVRPGDTLGEIAEQALGSSRRWPEIAALNPGLDPSNLRVGMRIVLPQDAGAKPVAAAASVAKGAAPADGQAPSSRSYRVRAGDSLWRIADRELGDGERWRELVAANRGINPDKLIVGAVLALPGTGGERAAATRQDAGQTVAQTSKPKASARKARVQ